jgi:hypothetical protein
MPPINAVPFRFTVSGLPASTLKTVSLPSRQKRISKRSRPNRRSVSVTSGSQAGYSCSRRGRNGAYGRLRLRAAVRAPLSAASLTAIRDVVAPEDLIEGWTYTFVFEGSGRPWGFIAGSNYLLMHALGPALDNIDTGMGSIGVLPKHQRP